MCDFDICKSILLIMKSMLYYAFYTKNVMHFPFSQLTFVSKYIFLFSLSSVQFSSVTQSCLTLWDPMNRTTPGLPVHHQLLKFTQEKLMFIKSVMPSSHLILCRPLFRLPPILPSIRVFSNELTLRLRSSALSKSSLNI